MIVPIQTVHSRASVKLVSLEMDSIVQVRHLFITEIVPIHNFNKNNELTNNITNIMEIEINSQRKY